MANQKMATVYNPSRKITGAKAQTANPVKKRKKRRNPTNQKKVVNASSGRRKRRRSNPSSTMGLLGAALMVGIGVVGFNWLTARFMPSTSVFWRVGVKGGAAYLLQSNFGTKIPILGKYKNELALVLAVSAVVDLLEWQIMPMITGFGNRLLSGGQTVQVIDASEMSDDAFYLIEEIEEDNDDDDDDDF